MPSDISFFDEKRSIVAAKTEWGNWWQNVQEVHILVDLPANTKARNIKVDVKPKFIEVTVHGNLIFKGPLIRPVYSEETIWTIEEGQLNLVLAKADHSFEDEMWKCILADGSFEADAITLLRMREFLDLERMQMEHPGMDFSRSKLNGRKIPDTSNDRLMEMAQHQSSSVLEET